MVENFSKRPGCEVFRQQGLLGRPDIITGVRFLEDQSFWREKTTAFELVGGFIELLPEKAELSWTIYDFENSKWGLHEGQSLYFLAKERAGLLLEEKERILEEYPMKGIEDLSFSMVAVASAVRIQGSVLHFAQMDFNGRAESLDLAEEFFRRALIPGRWAILDSGASYHAWRVDRLLSVDQWKKFMTHAWDFGQLGRMQELILEKAFIEASDERGFTALRIHPVPGFEGFPSLETVIEIR